MADPTRLSDVERDALREVANIGAGHAATALSTMTDRRIMISVPQVSVRPIEDVAGILGPPEGVVVAIFMNMLGDLTGRTAVILPVGAARVLCDLLLRRAPGTTGEFGGMETSSLKETGNILTSAYLSALSDFMGMMLVPSVPSLVTDYAGAIVSTAHLDLSPQRDVVFCVDTSFRLEGATEPLQGEFLLFPDSAALGAIFDAIRIG